MKSVRLNFLFIFFLTFGLLYQGYADCPWNIKSNTWWEAIVGGNWVKEIKVKAIKDQGVDGYFNPKIRVCAYDGKSYCYDLHSGASCQKIYGTQRSGAGVSAAVFVDWEGTKEGNKMKNGMNWEWAEGVTDKEKVKFANSPKVCACSQKIACADNATKLFAGATSVSIDECDTCYQTTVKCAPVPLAPGPPPFCEQLAMSSPQVRIVPITNEENDYFDPKVKVIIGDLIGKDGKKLDFPRKYKKDKAGGSPTSGGVKEHSILDRDGTTHYFETYRKKNKLCTEYRGTEKEESQRRLQFPARCFPVPPAPEPKGVEVVNGNTLKVEIKMSRENCMKQVNGSYSDGYCTFNISFDASEDRKKIDPRSFRVVKPRIVKETTKNSNDESNITDVIEGILEKDSLFAILEKYGLTPNIGIQLPNGEDYSITNSDKSNKKGPTQLELDDMGLPKIKVRYMRVKDQENSKRKMLCLSGWKPEPEEFVLKRENEIISLKSMGAGYIKYNAVYSKESKQFYYLPSREREEKKEIYVDILTKPQDKLNDIVFDKQGYVFFPDENKQEKGKCSYCVNENSKVNEAFQSGKGLKVVYKLIDGKREEKCEQGQDGCLCFGEDCSRSTQYLNKEDGQSFYLRYEEVDCKDKDGRTLKNERGEIQKCTQLKDQLIKANRPEVFYADKLCRLDFAGLKNRLREIIVKQLKDKKQKLEESNQGSYEPGDGYTDDLSLYDYVEIEAWGGGEAGHIDGKAKSTESRPGIPGDYIKAKLKIDPNHPVIKVKVTEGGGGQEDSPSNKDGGPTWIEMCDSHRQDCEPLITVAGGGEHRIYGGQSYKDTIVHEQNLKLEEEITKGDKLSSTEDNKIAYIDDGKIKYKNVTECNKSYANKTYGAGGCVNKDNGSYSKGSPGHVKIKPMFDKIDENKIEKIDSTIEEIIQNPNSIESIGDSWINKLDPDIINTIKEEIRKELLGSEPKDSES
ncbi:MAG: hypothetical protein LKM45_03470 [Wolbachia endosymbiont of Alcedoecus sp.]|nr:hypothetical protein [Wolbachia endosymbiont of Alcedoecus sp.]